MPCAVNQFELSPVCQQRHIQSACRKHGVFPQAYAPLAQASVSLFGSAAVRAASTAHGVMPAQVCLRWSLLRGFGPLPRTATPSRLISNCQLGMFDPSVQPDMREISVAVASASSAASPLPPTPKSGKGGAEVANNGAAVPAEALSLAVGSTSHAGEAVPSRVDIDWSLDDDELLAIDELDSEDGSGRQCWNPHKVR